MTDDEILVHKLELAITGRTSIPMGAFRSDRHRDAVCKKLGGTDWWYDPKENATIIEATHEADEAVKLWSHRLFQQAIRSTAAWKLSKLK